MKQFSPLKNELLKEGVDFVIVRELVGGLYFGEKSQGVNRDGLRYVCDIGVRRGANSKSCRRGV